MGGSLLSPGQLAMVGLWLLLSLVFMRAGMAFLRTALPGSQDLLAAGLGLPAALAVFWQLNFWVGQAALVPAAWLGLAVVVLSALVIVRRRDTGREAIGRFVPPGFAGPATVFVAGFLFLVLLRAMDPSVHPIGGEKFLDFGLLNSVLRSSTLPPEDMWFAGEPAAYYYGGHMLVGQLARLTGIDAAFAYNLGLAGFYGTLVAGVYGIAATLGRKAAVDHRLSGGLAVFFVGLASNLMTPGNLILAVLPGDVSRSIADSLGFGLDGLANGFEDFSYWTASRVIDGTVTEFPLFAWLNGDMHAHMMSTGFTLLVVGLLAGYYWTPESARWRRRILLFGLLPPVTGLLAVTNTWSFPTPMGLTVLVVYFTPTAPGTLLPHGLAAGLAGRRRAVQEVVRFVLAIVAGIGVALGGLLWSLPFWLQSVTERSLGFFPDRTSLAGLLLVHGAFLLLFTLYVLRHTGARSTNTRRGLLLGLVVLGLGVAVGPVGHVSLVLLLVVGWVLLRMTSKERAVSGAAAYPGPGSSPEGVAHSAPAPVGNGGRSDPPDPEATGGLNDDGSRAERTATSEETDDRPGTAAAESPKTSQRTNFDTPDAKEVESDEVESDEVESDEVETPEDNSLPSPGFETVLILAGVGLALLVEFVHIDEGPHLSRFNTVFKVYAEVWIFFGTAAGVVLARLLARHDRALSIAGGRWRPAMRGLAALLVVATSVYAGLALVEHAEGTVTDSTDGLSLDATAFVETEQPREARAIEWIADRDGQPTIVTGVPARYHWRSWDGKGASAPASLTGVPTVLGWSHERQYRGEGVYVERKRDVRAIYTGNASVQTELLQKYDVEFVYVGPAERTNPDFHVITIGDHPAVEGATEFQSVRIYRVNGSRLDAR